MNLSSKVVVNATGGETRTITCFTCGMPSSQEWAQKIRSRPLTPTKPYFPFLMQMIPPHGAILREDGSTFLCAFCHASLESQWNDYEVQQVPVPPANRKYIVHKFICGVCSVETYRKRVRALPFQEFPFLINKRQPGSLTLGNNPLAVVCLDCSETLWAQSAEYDRWGLPIHKRHFNWMARPPPPEDSVEATVARLPSGETQLPRCPPIEPLVPSKFSLPPNVPESVISVKQKAKICKPETNPVNSSGRSMARSPTAAIVMSESKPGRKVSITSTSVPVIESVSTTPSQPPVVTVAPMSSYNTLTNLRKDSMSVPPNLTPGYPKFDGIPQPCGMQGPLGPPPLYPRSALFPSPSSNYSTFPWPGRETSYGENYTYTNIPNTAESLKPPTSSWSWLQSPSPDLLRYQSFMSSFQNRGYGDVYLNHSQPMYGGNSPPRFTGAAGDTGSSSTPYLSPYRLHTSISSPTVQQYSSTLSVTSSSNGPICAPPALNPSPPIFSYEDSNRVVDNSHPAEYETAEPNLRIPADSGSNPTISQSESKDICNSNEIIYPKKHHLAKLRKLSTTNVNIDVPSPNSSPNKNLADQGQSDNDADNDNFESAAYAHGSSRTTPYSKTEERERNIVSSATMKHNSEGYVGKKWQWQSHARNMDLKTKNVPPDELRPMDCSLTNKNDLTRQNLSHSSLETEYAIDLSVSSPLKTLQSATTDDSGNGSSKKFMIAYLCKSEGVSPPTGISGNGEEKRGSRSNSVSSEKDEKSGRNSVIVSVAKSDDADDADDSDGPLIVPNDNESVSQEKELNLSSNEKPKKVSDLENDQISDCDGTKEDAETNVVCVSTELIELNNSNNYHKVNNIITKLNSEAENLEGSVLESSLSVSDSDIKPDTATFLKDTFEEFIQKKKKHEKDLAVKEKKQSDFLAELGLITPEKRKEIELNSLISRCEHKTLPPLKRRAGTPPTVKLPQEFERQLLQVAFDDPSLKQNVNDPKKSSFLEVLGLKTASMNDKTRRESEWRLVLTERIMREKRCSRLRGYKRPWDTYSNVENLLTPLTKSCRSDSNPSVLQSLSLTLPLDSVESTCTNCHTGSSDLLTTVESRETSQTDVIDWTTKSATSVVIKNGMSIVYPKYIPSYAVKSDVDNKYVPPQDKTSNILNVPIYSGNFPEIDNSTESSFFAVTQEDSSDMVIQSVSQSLVVCHENILKVPVINPGSLRTISRRNSITSCPTDDTDDLTSSGDEIEEILAHVTKNQTCSGVNIDDDVSAKVESINRSCTENWRQTRECIEAFVTSSPCEGIANKIQLARSADNLKTLRKYLKSQQDEMKTTEKMLKLKEKQLVKQLRALNKNTVKHTNNRSKIADKEV